jgi:hypothetical protein
MDPGLAAVGVVAKGVYPTVSESVLIAILPMTVVAIGDRRNK